MYLQLRTVLDTIGEVYSKAVVLGSMVALLAMLAAGVPLLSTATQVTLRTPLIYIYYRALCVSDLTNEIYLFYSL